jgi:hypothetical protein
VFETWNRFENQGLKFSRAWSSKWTPPPDGTSWCRESSPSPGIDFTKLHFGRKIFGQIFTLQMLDKFLPPKKLMQIYLSILDNNVGFFGIWDPCKVIITNKQNLDLSHMYVNEGRNWTIKLAPGWPRRLTTTKTTRRIHFWSNSCFLPIHSFF